MHRSSPLDVGSRAFHGAGRGVVTRVDDNHLMQEVGADMMHGDSRSTIEHPQPYGFTAVILPAEEGSDEAAEAFFMHAGGNRAHPVAAVIDDRRHRPYGLQGGESAQYDDQGQMSYLARDGAYLISNREMASVRHVEKAKQPRTPGQSSGYDHKGTVNTEIRCLKDRILILVDDVVLADIDRDLRRVYLGGKKDDPMARVVTEDGPSLNVYARIPD